MGCYGLRLPVTASRLLPGPSSAQDHSLAAVAFNRCIDPESAASSRPAPGRGLSSTLPILGLAAATLTSGGAEPQLMPLLRTDNTQHTVLHPHIPETRAANDPPVFTITEKAPSIKYGQTSAIRMLKRLHSLSKVTNILYPLALAILPLVLIG